MSARNWAGIDTRIAALLAIETEQPAHRSAHADQQAAAWRDVYDRYGVTLHEETDLHTALVTVHATAVLARAYADHGHVHPAVASTVTSVVLQAEARLVLAAPRELTVRLARTGER